MYFVCWTKYVFGFIELLYWNSFYEKLKNQQFKIWENVCVLFCLLTFTSISGY